MVEKNNEITIIKLIDVYKRYKSRSVDIQVLENINLEIKKEDFLIILGKSGCGKTTLLNILGFIDDLTSGLYIFEGRNSNEFNKNQMAKIRNKKIGFIFQSYNLINTMTAIENVEMPMGYNGINSKIRKERASNLLECVGLANRFAHIPVKLSGGEQQRVAIARAMANDPLFILADEPTGNLDEKSAEDIMNILKDLNKHGTTIIMVTHDSDMIKYATRHINISNGHITE